MVPAFRIILTGMNEVLIAFVSPEAGEWLEADVMALHAHDRVEQSLDIQLLESLEPFTASVGLQEQIAQDGMALTRAHPINDKAAHLAALVRTFDSFEEADAYALEHGYHQVGQYVGTTTPQTEPLA